MKEVEAFVPRAGFIFAGTVLEPEGSAVDFAVDGRTAVVRVNEVFRAPDGFGQQAGSIVTVVAGQDEGFKPEEQAIFFTNGWLYGETIAVVEVGRLPSDGPEPPAGLREQLSMAISGDAERPLAERIASAQLVVVGRVVGLAPATVERRRITEHDPDWWEARIDVEDTLKGRPPGKDVRVHFAASRDVAWFRAPKLEPGQEGVWLLQRGEGYGREGLVVIDPLDAHPKDSAVIELIRRLSHTER